MCSAGKVFFESAAVAPLQIKPLLVYYGVVAFAQAITVARECRSLSTLIHAHGLSDTTAATAKVQDLRVRIENAGTFQEFNEALAPLGRIHYYDEHSMPQFEAKPFDLTDALGGRAVGFRDILARIPAVRSEYSRTIGVPNRTKALSAHFMPGGVCGLRIDEPIIFSDRDSLDALIHELRNEYPFLLKWRLAEAVRAWGNSVIIFDNVIAGHTTEDVQELESGFSYRRRYAGEELERISPFQILPPMAGGYTRSQWAVIQPLDGTQLNEYSLQFLGSFLLSSLVRYRPQIWQQAISRSISANYPADDRALSLIEKFLDVVLQEFPTLVTRVMDFGSLA